jgi:phosphotriesterase-related protein
MSVVRTILGDIDPAELGATYAHEHLVLDSPIIAAVFPHILLDDSAVAIREVQKCHAVGVRTMVDCMPSAGRDVVRLAEISRATKMNVIAATGLHHERYYGPRHWTSRITVSELAQLFIDDIEIGIDDFDNTGPYVRRSPFRAGIIKVATGGGDLSDRDTLLFDAAVQAHHRTGAPILTHCEHGHGALEQVAALTGRGVKPSRILLSHIDKVVDLDYQLAIARTGAWMLFDQGLRQPEITANTIAQLTNAGYLSQILIGTDGARRDLWSEYGGSPGLAWLASEMPATVQGCGITENVSEDLLVLNPARAFALNIG